MHDDQGRTQVHRALLGVRQHVGVVRETSDGGDDVSGPLSWWSGAYHQDGYTDEIRNVLAECRRRAVPRSAGPVSGAQFPT
jgi:hypothetical protein